MPSAMFIEIPPYGQDLIVSGIRAFSLAHTTHINPNLIVSATNARDFHEKNPEGSIFQMVNGQFFFLPGNHADNLALISNPLYVVPPRQPLPQYTLTAKGPFLPESSPDLKPEDYVSKVLDLMDQPTQPRKSHPLLDPKRKKKATIQEL